MSIDVKIIELESIIEYLKIIKVLTQCNQPKEKGIKCYWNQNNECILKTLLKPLRACHFLLDKVGVDKFTPWKTPFYQNTMYPQYHEIERNDLIERVE